MNECLEDRGSFSFLLLFSIKLYEHQEVLTALLLSDFNNPRNSSAASNDDNVSQCKASVGEKITVSVLTFDHNCQTENEKRWRKMWCHYFFFVVVQFRTSFP